MSLCFYGMCGPVPVVRWNCFGFAACCRKFSVYASYAGATTYWNGHILLREVLQKDHVCTHCTIVAGDEKIKSKCIYHIYLKFLFLEYFNKILINAMLAAYLFLFQERKESCHNKGFVCCINKIWQKAAQYHYKKCRIWTKRYRGIGI